MSDQVHLIGGETMEEDDADLMSIPRFGLPTSADSVVALWQQKMSSGELATEHFQDHWCAVVPKIYSPQTNRTCLDWNWDEVLAESLLIKPLEQFVWGDEAARPRPGASTFCGRVFKQGEPAYSCRECGMDNTCVLCVECFKVSAHRQHKYKMSQSGGGGCCDCGDTEAWRRDPFCDLHKSAQESSDSNQSESAVPEEVVRRMKVVAAAAFSYCFRLLTLDYAPGLPSEFRVKNTEMDPMQILDQPDCYCTVLYNDESHTFEQVITTLTRVMKCSHRDAVELVSHIDRVGRALVKCSSFEKCEQLKSEVEKITARHGPSLKALVMHAHLMAHQVFAMKLLNWLETFVCQEPALRLALSQVALEEGGGGCSGAGEGSMSGSGWVVCSVMQNDCRLWKAARTAWHRLFITAMLMDYNTKKSLAVLFTKNYATVLKDYIRDDHDHSFSISSLSVQLYTTPTLAHYLIAHHDALYIVLNTFVSECTRRCNQQGRLEFERGNVTAAFKRAQCILLDVKYLLSSVPTQLNDDLRRGFLHGLTLLLNLLAMMQGMDAITRQVGQHMEFEPEWESAFNLHVKLAYGVTLALAWCATDLTLTAKAYRLALKKLYETESFADTAHRELGGQSASVIPYDVSSQPVSIHLPLSRFVAGLHLLLHQHGLHYNSPVLDMPKPRPEELIEPVLRTTAMIAQVHAGMWRRNGYALLNQLYFYHNVKCRAEMLDRDIVMLQIGASLIESNEFIIHLLNKFGLLGWAAPDFEEKSLRGEDDSMRHTISLVEEFLCLLITIIGSRYVPGVGEVTAEDRTKKEIIQALCIRPMPHSELNKQLPENELHETGLEAVIDSVAEFQRAGAGGEERRVYKLREPLYEQYDTFFYHYTREELSRSEEAQRNRRKAAGEPECCPPPPLPALAPPFRLLAQLPQCDAALHVLKTVLTRATDLRARSFSELQVHKALHLIGYALRDEESGHYEFVAFAERAHRAGLDTLLAQLAGSARVEAHRPLLLWTLNKMRSVLGKSEDSVGTSKNMETEQKPPSTETAEFDKAWRAEMAAARRAKIMAQMQAAQNNFVSNNATLFNETETGAEEAAEGRAAGAEPPVCGVALGVSPTPTVEAARVCIMCQEEARVEGKSPLLVLVAFVQHSSVLSRVRSGGNGLEPRAWAEAWLPRGVGAAPHVSSCGHVLHAECWRKYVENVELKEKRRPYRSRQPASFDVDKQEYLCPLCERLCNAALPLLASVRTSACSEWLGHAAYTESVALVLKHRVSSEAVHVCTEQCAEMACTAREGSAGASDMSEQESDSEADKTPVYVSTHARHLLPQDFLAHFDGEAVQYRDMTRSLVTELSVNIHKKLTDPGESGAAGQLAALLRATSYTILATDALLKAEGRALIGGLPSRHRDTLHALIRLVANLPSIWDSPKQLAHHAINALNTLVNKSVFDYEAFGLLLPLIVCVPALFAKSAPPARPGHLSRRITIDVFRANLTRALIVADLDDCSSIESMEDDAVDPMNEYEGLLELLFEVRQGKVTVEVLCPKKVWQAVRKECHSFLRSCCLLFHFLSDVPPPDELNEVGGESWEAMTGYLDLPSTFKELLGAPDVREQVLKRANKEETNMWLNGMIQPTIGRDPTEPPRLIPLPEDFSELMNAVAMYTCPNSEKEDSKYPSMCLVCGQMLCSQSYCCQSESDKKPIGASVAHAMECGAGAGVFLRVRDCETLLLAAPNRGALLSAPYLDQYGETDQGLRRGNPLRLCPERYEKLRMLWLSHGLYERIARSVDSATLLPTVWQHM